MEVQLRTCGIHHYRSFVFVVQSHVTVATSIVGEFGNKLGSVILDTFGSSITLKHDIRLSSSRLSDESCLLMTTDNFWLNLSAALLNLQTSCNL